MPTTTTVPSSDPSDLLFNAEKLDEVVTSSALEYTDRLGIQRKTVAGALAAATNFLPRGAWATATLYSAKDLVLQSGSWYFCLTTHTSGATFAGDLATYWRLYQDSGVRAELDDDANVLKGAALVALNAALVYAAGSVGAGVIRLCANVRNYPWMAKGDGTTDDYAAIQAAITFAQANGGGEVFLPPRDPGAYYRVTSPLVITAPVRIRGHGPSAVQIIAQTGDLASGEYVLDINCVAGDQVEHISLEGFTLRSLDAVPNGLRIKNAAYVKARDLRIYNVANGLDIDGSRCFSNELDIVFYGITGTSARYLAGFNGGGQWKWGGSTSFSGAYGLTVDATASVDGMTFDGCNWEQCTTRAMLVQGSVQGLNLEGVRGEGGSGNGFEFAPVAGKEVVGLSINGMSFYSGTVSAIPIILGTAAGTGGVVRGFSITGNRVGYAAQNYMVQLNAEAASGVISGNKLAENSPTSIVSAQRDGVVVFANEKGNARLPEYWGLATWGVEEGSFTPTDNSGASLTFAAAAGRYTRIGRTVFWQAAITYPTTASTANAQIAGLPLAVGGLGGANEGRAGAHVDVSNVGSGVGVLQGVGSTTGFAFYSSTGNTAITNVTLSGKVLYVSGTYSI